MYQLRNRGVKAAAKEIDGLIEMFKLPTAWGTMSKVLGPCHLIDRRQVTCTSQAFGRGVTAIIS